MQRCLQFGLPLSWAQHPCRATLIRCSIINLEAQPNTRSVQLPVGLLAAAGSAAAASFEADVSFLWGHAAAGSLYISSVTGCQSFHCLVGWCCTTRQLLAPRCRWCTPQVDVFPHRCCCVLRVCFTCLVPAASNLRQHTHVLCPVTCICAMHPAHPSYQIVTRTRNKKETRTHKHTHAPTLSSGQLHSPLRLAISTDMQCALQPWHARQPRHHSTTPGLPRAHQGWTESCSMQPVRCSHTKSLCMQHIYSRLQQKPQCSCCAPVCCRLLRNYYARVRQETATHAQSRTECSFGCRALLRAAHCRNRALALNKLGCVWGKCQHTRGAPAEGRCGAVPKAALHQSKTTDGSALHACQWLLETRTGTRVIKAHCVASPVALCIWSHADNMCGAQAGSRLGAPRPGSKFSTVRTGPTKPGCTQHHRRGLAAVPWLFPTQASAAHDSNYPVTAFAIQKREV